LRWQKLLSDIVEHDAPLRGDPRFEKIVASLAPKSADK
jgi:hypothetical protein